MNILVLSPHTDDCELGCGGSLTKWLAEGHNITVILFSLCKDSIPEGFNKDITFDEFRKNMEGLGIKYDIHKHDVRHFPELRQTILQELVNANKYHEPDLVVGTSLNDIHQDHKTIAEEMQRAFRCSILSYELPYTSIDFKPNYYMSLERKHLDKKIELYENYKSQLDKGKYSRERIESLARIRGQQIDKEYAEAFECVRWLES